MPLVNKHKAQGTHIRYYLAPEPVSPGKSDAATAAHNAATTGCTAHAHQQAAPTDPASCKQIDNFSTAPRSHASVKLRKQSLRQAINKKVTHQAARQQSDTGLHQTQTGYEAPMLTLCHVLRLYVSKLLGLQVAVQVHSMA